jgi:hypothetical protein
MNSVGWGGGALGPLVVGYVTQHGRHATQMENMSEAMALCGVVYLAGAALLLVTILALALRGAKPDGGAIR